MAISSTFDTIYRQSKNNRWMRYFSVFCRIALAAGFLPSGYVKIMGERFTDLHNNHPMGHYLQALYETGYYYTVIGVLQVTAAIFLLVPRTATLGALIYFPIILNICILSHSVCFIGSLHSSPLMVLANIYLLCWDYDKLKYILQAGHFVNENVPKPQKLSNRFPILFFGGSLVVVVLLLVGISKAYHIQPFNTLPSCEDQCKESTNPQAVTDFCNCIHTEGRPYHQCRDEYYEAVANDK